MATLAEPAVAVGWGLGGVRPARTVVVRARASGVVRPLSPWMARGMSAGSVARSMAARHVIVPGRQVVVGVMARKAVRRVEATGARQVAGAVVARSLSRSMPPGDQRQVMYGSVAGYVGRRCVVDRSGLRIGWPVWLTGVSAIVPASGSVRIAPAVVSLAVGHPVSCGRFDRLLESWSELPAPWASVDVPEVGYIGRSMAALAVLRGALVEWSPETGRVIVGGQVVISDAGTPVLAASEDASRRAVIGYCKAIVTAIGISAGLPSDERRRQQEASRAAHSRAVKKAAAAACTAGLPADVMRALQAEFAWRERRL